MKQQALLICIIGIDGSGKTTQAKLLVDWLSSKGIKSMYTWSRGEVLFFRNILLNIGRLALGTSSHKIKKDIKSYNEYQSSKTKLMKYSFVRLMWSGMTYIEHLVQINMDIRKYLSDGWVVVCDRYLWDSRVDIAVLNNKKPEWLSNKLNALADKLIPQPAITFLIDLPEDEAMKRKNDIPSYEYVKRRRELYSYLASQNAFKEINGLEPMDAVHKNIIDWVEHYSEG